MTEKDVFDQMKKYIFEDTELYNGEYESVQIKAEDEEDAWNKFIERHIDSGKGSIMYETAKERYKVKVKK